MSSFIYQILLSNFFVLNTNQGKKNKQGFSF